MHLRQKAKGKRKRMASWSIFPAISRLPFPVTWIKNWLFSNVVKYVRDRMLQYDGFYYARHETIDAGDVKAQTSQKPTRQELISGFRTMKQAYEYCYSPLDGIFIACAHLYTWVKRDQLE